MARTERHLRSHQLPSAALIPVVALLVSTACGSDTAYEPSASAPAATFRKVTASDRVFTLADFTRAGFKKSLEFNVEELPGATAVYFGFWRPEGLDFQEYEIRFYPSHADAVEYGTVYAEDATGPAANLDEETAMWKEGLRKRRYFHAGPVGTHGSGAVHAKYGGYTVYGNTVLLCEGANPEHSLERCASLMGAVLAAGTE